MKYKSGTKIQIVQDLRINGEATGQLGIYCGILPNSNIAVLKLDSGEQLAGNQCQWKALNNARLSNEEKQQLDQKVGKTKSKNRAANRNFFHHKKKRSR